MSAGAPRIVSLVPSLTELVCALGLAPYLVGRTGFCIHPRALLRDVPKLGGTKGPMMDRLRALRPTHLILNREENEKAVYEEACTFVPNVIVTYPITLQDNRALYGEFGDIFECRARAQRLTEAFDRAHASILSRRFSPLPVLYLIWREPWMAVSRDTFISHMLAAVNLLTVPSDLADARAGRYPTIDTEAFSSMGPRAILLSSEPYRFTQRHLEEIARMPHLAEVPCRLIDGEMTSWYGLRAIRGLRYLARFRDRLDRDLTRIADVR
ncbi:MAG: helical backbone metal receptor [Burkholderiaceae bacterium]